MAWRADHQRRNKRLKPSRRAPGSVVPPAVTWTPNGTLTFATTPPPTPPPDVSVAMITYNSEVSHSLITTNIQKGSRKTWLYHPADASRTWYIHQPFPIPTGYYGLSIVPAAEQTGQLTNYQAGVPKCEESFQDQARPLEWNEMAVAISWLVFQHQLCGRRVSAWIHGETGQNKSAVFVVRDRCDACRPEDIDILEDVFDQVVIPMDKGRANVTWRWLRDYEMLLPASTAK